MKNKCLFLLIFSFILFGCRQTKALEGKWKTVSLEKDGQIQKLYASNIQFTYSEAFYETKGSAGVNLFNVYVKDKGKSVETFGMVNTGFRGNAEAMEFEDMFFDAFLNSDSYKIEKDILIFYNQEKNLELKLKKIQKESEN
ncbi:MAG: META domain-containing protein [Treponema sp.]|uniref:META domain-containing protein n=1 Tax=Treponema sp. TaxID=166 RepID=UPI00298E773B|nr:META domain-containing protein [Treponema sp.]MCQ2601872.1 META domain-containing protein [Treponema sp.]